MKVIRSSEPFSFTKYIERRLAGRKGEMALDAIFLKLHWESSLDRDVDDFSRHLWQTVQVLKHCDGYSFIGDGQVLFKFLQRAVGGPIGWTGRAAQYLSGIYFLIAVLTGRGPRTKGRPT